MQRAKVAFVLVLLVCLGMTARQVHKPNLADFQVYEAAAVLVHERQSVHMYDDADNEPVFQLKFAGDSTPFAQAAHEVGVDRVRLYIYPPILADLVLPLVFVSTATAGKLWLLINLVALFVTAALMIALLELRWKSLGTVAVVLGLFSLFSTGMCLIWGQITIVLLLLWMAGLYFYRRGWYAASAIVLALATAIKLTPLLVVVPFLIWREWQWLRAYFVALAVFFGLMFLANSPASLTDYFFHVMPSMSGGGIPDFENKSLLADAQLLYVTLHGGATRPVTMAIPKGVVTIGKAGCLSILLFAIALVYRLRSAMRMADRVMTLSLFALLSVCIAPISWKHAYVVVFLALALLWAEALRQKVSAMHLVLLSICSIELGSFLFDSIVVKATHGVLQGVLSFLAPAAGILLVLLTLLRMRPIPGRAAVQS